MRDYIEFYLNDKRVKLHSPQADMTLLAFLREDKRLVGTKEGCAEGDCGACTVLVGRMRDGVLRYDAVNTCISFIAMMDGAHVVTVEALSAHGALHWVQSALVDYHGTQCGFCTPGIVMSLYAMWMNNPKPDRVAIEKALQGNLCRCTGYASILRGVEARVKDAKLDDDPLVKHREDMLEKLAAIDGGGVIADGFFIPRSIDELAELYDENLEARLVAGATDVGLWVTKRLEKIDPVIFLARIDGFDDVKIAEDVVRIGAMASIDRLEALLAEELPELADFWPLFAGQQVRNLGTIGGNIANASPIGDLPPVLIALGAKLVLRKGKRERVILLEDFFVDYGKQDRKAGEFLLRIDFPRPLRGKLRVYKVSKRTHEDISSVFAAISIGAADGVINHARIAYGGMAAAPKRAFAAEAALLGKPFTEESFRAAMAALAEEFTPISDMRASAEYRMKLAQNLLLKYWLEEEKAGLLASLG